MLVELPSKYTLKRTFNFQRKAVRMQDFESKRLTVQVILCVNIAEHWAAATSGTMSRLERHPKKYVISSIRAILPNHLTEQDSMWMEMKSRMTLY